MAGAGPTMADVKVGSLVWVRRKNGKWWPAKVVSHSEVASHQFYSRRTRVRLLGRHNGSVECYNIKNSSQVKLFRCGEFDHLIREAEACQASTSINDSKYASRELAIVHALQLEKQGSGLKRPARQLNQSSVCRAKRSKCVQLPVESCYPVEALPLASLLSKVSVSAIRTNDSCLRSQMIDEDISGKNVSRSFLRDSEYSVEGGAPHPQGSYQRQRRSINSNEKDTFSYSSKPSLENLTSSTTVFQKLNGEENSRADPVLVSKGRSSIKFQNTTDSMEIFLPGDAGCEEKRGFRYGCFEDSDVHCFESMSNDYQNGMKGKLIEVDVRVEVSYRKEHVPLVCLTSGLNQKAIIGHPVDIEALEGTYEAYAVRDKSFSEKLNTNVKRIDQLVWRSSKRSPVCYITKCCSSDTEHDKTETACRKTTGYSHGARNEEFPQLRCTALKCPNLCRKTMKEPFGSKGQKDKGNNHDLPLSTNCSSKTDGLKAQEGSGRQSCVPVSCVFKNLLSAVGGKQS